MPPLPPEDFKLTDPPKPGPGCRRSQSEFDDLVEQHRYVQGLAKDVLEALGPTIEPDDSELSIARRAAGLLAARGVTETWYYACPALVLTGSRSTLSISGRTYQAAEERVGDLNVVTVDLSPLWQGVPGDCARTFFVENGRFTRQPDRIDFRRGAAVCQHLHECLRNVVTSATTFDEVFHHANREIERRGFENLDFLKNLGHSLTRDLTNRCYLEAGNLSKLGEVPFFTFEPHIRVMHGHWGYKWEDVYHFDAAGCLQCL